MPNDNALVFDTHCHTEFAYCAKDINAAAILDAADAAGLAGQCFTEHGPQLYCTNDDYWGRRHINEPRLWRQRDCNRMPAFREFIAPLRHRCAAIGLEVEADRDGHIIIHDDDRQWVDYLVGAIHWLPGEPTSDAAYANAVLTCCRALAEGGVDTLAHPLRCYRRDNPGFLPPESLYDELADLLATHDVAAEINYHINEPSEAFFRRCLDRGVKITFGSDSHAMWEVAAFTKHLAFLRRLAGRDDIADLLYRPPVRIANNT